MARNEVAGNSFSGGGKTSAVGFGFEVPQGVNEVEVVNLERLVVLQERINGELEELAKEAVQVADRAAGSEPRAAEKRDGENSYGYLYALAARQRETASLIEELRHQISRLARAVG